MTPKQVMSWVADEDDMEMLYGKMLDDGVTDYVVQGDGSLAMWREIGRHATVFIVPDEQEQAAALWWVTGFYQTAVSFHGCVFRPYRRRAAAFIRAACEALAGFGVTEVFFFSPPKRRDLVALFRRLGLERQGEINNGTIQVWAARIGNLAETGRMGETAETGGGHGRGEPGTARNEESIKETGHV